MKKFLIFLVVVLVLTSTLLVSCVSGSTSASEDKKLEDNGDIVALAENDGWFSYADVSPIHVGMSMKDLEDYLKQFPDNSYIFGVVGYFINDYETNHVFQVTLGYTAYPVTVTGIEDTGMPVGYIAPREDFDKVHDGMTIREIVNILGAPVEQFGSGMIYYVWKLGDENTEVTLNFRDGERMIYDASASPSKK